MLLYSLAALAAAVALGVIMKDQDGRVSLIAGEWHVQTTFSVAVLLLLLIAFAVYLVVRIASGLVRLPRNVNRWSGQRRLRRSEEYLARGLRAMVEGEWTDAERAFAKGAPNSTQPMANYLVAARAAQHQGALDRRDRYLRLAHAHGEEAPVAVGLTEAELQLDQHADQQAYDTLKRLEEEHPGTAPVQSMLVEASARLHQWDELLSRVEDLKGGALSPDQVHARRLEAYAGLLREAGSSGNADRLAAQWARVPNRLRGELYLLEVYVRERLRFADTADCEVLVRKALKKRWDAALVVLYGLLHGPDPARQLNHAQRWLSQHPGDAALLLTVARLCRRNELWGKARGYLEESIAAQPTPDAYRELAELSAAQGDHAAAEDYYREGLRVATGDQPASR